MTENREDWIGDNDGFDILQDSINNKVNLCIMGVRGSGKTTLLNCFFQFSYRKTEALEGHKIICFVDLAVGNDGEDVCNNLADKLINTIKSLFRGTTVLPGILEGIKEIESDSSAVRLEQIIEFLHDEEGYFCVLIMDHFERFTSSPSVTMDHHEKLRSLIEAGKLQCIVATDYDLEQDSLPADVKGSYLLQKFTKKFSMHPFSESDTRKFIQRKEKGMKWPLDDDTISSLYYFSGGIPGILNFAVECVNENMHKNKDRLDSKHILESIYKLTKPFLTNWCKLLTSNEVMVLDMLMDKADKKDFNKCAIRDFSDEQIDILSAVDILKSRGVLCTVEYKDRNGNLRRDRDYLVRANSILFQIFCLNGGHKEAVSQNPLETTLLSKNANSNEISGLNTVEVKGNVYVMNGNMIINHQESIYGMLTDPDNLRVPKTKLADQLIHWLNDAHLSNMFSQIRRDKYSSEEDFEKQYDIIFNDIAEKMIPEIDVDEDQDLVNVSSDQLMTLDQRFEEVRKKDGIFSTDVLEKQSELCQFYLKTAVVTTDILNASGIYFPDCSPHLIFYGKALEVCLEDNFYDLFHKERNLSSCHLNGYDGGNSFLNMRPKDATIYNYSQLIKRQNSYLSTLCIDNNIITDVSADSQSEWEDWWEQFESDIDCARQIRVKTAHPKEFPNDEDIELMYKLLFGNGEEKGILERAKVGSKLAYQLVPHEIPQDVAEELKGSICEMTCTVYKPNGGINGVTSEGYAVKISQRQVAKYLDTLPNGQFEPEGKIFNVELIEARNQNDCDFFSAKFV